MADKQSQIGDEAIINATGNSWEHWMKVFKSMDAKALPHKDIARKLYEEHNVPGWWCQMLTVKFEQEIGRRTPGDSSEGPHISASMTVDGDLDTIYKTWQHAFEKEEKINDVELYDPVSLSQTDKWRYWKVKLQDGSKVFVSISQKSENKILVQITHDKIESEPQAEKWRAFWKAELERIY